MKKITSILLVAIMLLMNFSTMVIAVQDNTAPSIVSVSKDKESVKPGETIAFTVEVNDDYSGAETFMVQWYLNGDIANSLSKQFYDITNNVDVYEYTIPNNALAGNYQAVYVPINDYAGNHKEYNRTENEALISKFDFTVEESDQDILPPVVSNFKVITENVSAPGTIKVQYDVVDDKSGIQEYSGGVIISPINNLSHEIINTGVKTGEKTYQAEIHIRDNYEKYIFRGIQVRDNAGNWKNYSREELGLTEDIFFAADNYIEDKTAPKLLNIEYNKNKINIPDTLELSLDIEENESGVAASGLACFKCEDDNIKGNKYIATNYNSYVIIDNPELAQYQSPEPDNPYLFIGNIQSEISNQGGVLNNKVCVKLDFNESEEFRGNIYLDKLIIWDNAGNKSVYSVKDNTIEKKTITISKIVKEYTLETSTIVDNYINDIAQLPEGSTVLCNVMRKNQIIEKELFDAIKGKNIEITFMNIFGGGSSQIGGDSMSSENSNLGIQWVINGKDIVNPTKDINMAVELSVATYNKLLVPEYEFDFDKFMETDMKLQDESNSEEEFIAKRKEWIVGEVNKYFDYLEEQGYANIEKYREKAIELTNDELMLYGGAMPFDFIAESNLEQVNYIAIKFADNGELPCKTKVRIKADYATRGLIGAKGLKLYYMDGNNYELEQDSIELDEENYYNFTLTHNSEFWLSNGKVDKLEKVSDINKDEGKDIIEEDNNNTTSDTNIDKNNNIVNTDNPQTGDNIIVFITILGISILGIVFTLIVRKQKNK